MTKLIKIKKLYAGGYRLQGYLLGCGSFIDIQRTENGQWSHSLSGSRFSTKSQAVSDLAECVEQGDAA
jgi:hypothetical protein